jgi:mono/diheme cytochrome c family protein
MVQPSSLIAADFTPAARRFLDHYCAECHDADVKKGNLRVDQLSVAKPDRDHFNRLVLLFDRVQRAEMPPKKADQPETAERAAFLNELRTSLIEAESNQPVAAVRRMNRVEYESTLRDLLHLPLLHVKELLPEDGQQAGFDKVGGALDFSPVLVNKYMEAADVALKLALMDDGKKPESKIWREPAAKQRTVIDAIRVHCAVPLKGRELASGLTTFITSNPKTDIRNVVRWAQFKGEADSVALLTSVIGRVQPQGLQPDRFKPPVSGWYRVKFSAWSIRWMRTRAEASKRGLVRQFDTLGQPYFKNARDEWEYTRLAEEKPAREWMENVEFYGNTEVAQVVRASLNGEPIDYFDVPSLEPKVFELKVWLNPDEKVSFHAMALPAVGASKGGTSDGIRDYEGPGVAFDWFEVEGPLADELPPAKKQQLFGDKPAASDPRPLLTSFATQAFRRPATVADVEPYALVAESQLKGGASFESAMIAGYKAILCSPDFLMLGLEPGDYALASRLSYFLWNAPPDEELLRRAAQRELSHPESRKKQVLRMLADARSKRFIQHFLDEWIELKKIDFTTPDPALYPEYDAWLHDSMLAETRGDFRRMLERDIGVRGLIQGETVLINQRLAELYGLRGVTGSEFREVKLPPGSPRGGLLTQASVLKVTANGTATSPVLRGVWVMERILGIPRQPPPPNIPGVEPDATGAVTIRQMIEKHRADSTCASCHAKMDPPGFALENFDAIGGWRDRYRLAGKPKNIRVGKGNDARTVEEPTIEIVSDSAFLRNRVKMRLGSPVDASGELPDGNTFKDINELRALLLKDEDALARNVVSQLLTYATGRAPRFGDRDEIESIVSKTKPSHHGLRTIIEHIVASPLFAK